MQTRGKSEKATFLPERRTRARLAGRGDQRFGGQGTAIYAGFDALGE